MWAVTSQKTGTSARTLQRVLGLGSYQTAWAWLHKLRRAMVRAGRERLADQVEVDETYVGALERGVRGRGALKKILKAIETEEKGHGASTAFDCGRVRDACADLLQAFIDDTSAPWTLVRTDSGSATSG